MPFFQFDTYPVWLNLAVFAVAAVAIWSAGTRLSAYADLIADRTGLGKAFIGLALLAGITSLPEIGTTVTASWIGNASLAINNLLGGISMQTAILAVADFFVARGALTFFSPRPVLLLHGASLVLLLGLTSAAIASQTQLSLFGVGPWTVLLLGVYLLSVYLLKSYEGFGQWRPVEMPQQLKQQAEGQAEEPQRPYQEKSTRQLVLLAAGSGLLILVAGVTVAQVGDALASQTGLGSSFVGATLVAISTSLPELSTTVAAARLGSYAMAVSNIFGSNALMVGLLFVADLFYRPGPVLAAVDPSAVFAAAAGTVFTAVYLVGLIERRNKVVWRLGLDSLTVVVLYAGTLVVLYTLR